jgi:RHS repeat-associated protein
LTSLKNKTNSFKYDPLGRRIYKSSYSGTSIYAYDGDNLIEEVNASGGVVARYSQNINVMDEPLAMLRSGATSYYHADGLSSITSLSNGAGSLAQTYGYDSFGKHTSSSGSLTNPFQYTARELDSETGLYHYRARYYDPAAGRFISADPIGFFSGGVNFYSYVGDSPIDLVDPSGNHALLNPKSRCAKVFANALKTGLCPEDFANAFNDAAHKVPIYTVPSPNDPRGNLTQDAISGNGNASTLGAPFFGVMNPSTAYAITNGKQPAIVLGPGYFAESWPDRIATLLHEEFHAVTGMDDADIFALFSQYGLPDAGFQLWPHPTKEFSDWIKAGCPKKPGK